MDYEEFRDRFLEEVQQKLYERGSEIDISINTVEKMNQSYEAMTVRPVGNNVGMNLNLEAFVAKYEEGMSFDSIVAVATDTISTHLSEMPAFDTAMLTDYEQMKDKLAMEVVSADRNAELLSKVPHQEMEDMAVVYRFVVDSDETGRATGEGTDYIRIEVDNEGQRITLFEGKIDSLSDGTYSAYDVGTQIEIKIVFSSDGMKIEANSDVSNEESDIGGNYNLISELDFSSVG